MVKAKWRTVQERVERALKARRPPLGPGQRNRLESADLVAVLRHRKTAPEWIQADTAIAEAHSNGLQAHAAILTTDAGDAYLIIPLDLS